MAPRFFEEFEVGTTHRFGSYEVRKDEMVAFAERYDPQSFHVDEAAARESMYGGLIASGWYTGAVAMRMVVDELLRDAAVLGAVGLDELRWVRPVRPGDVLSETVEVLDTRPSESHPDRGYVRIGTTVENQDDEPVLTMESVVMFGRRER